jgi:L-glyceraldehyde 3-phosphate reductase
MTTTMSIRTLGASGPKVSALSLGSWRTFESMTRRDGLRVMHAAREAGISFLDDARYDDATGSAPMPTGYSEVVFGELFRAAGWDRDHVIVANKLWWEFWPRQGAVAELQESLRRMGLDHVDLIYAERPPAGALLEELLADVAAVLELGLARWWGVLNWSAELTAQCLALCDDIGMAYPVATQLPYSLLRRSIVEDPGMQDALARGPVSVIASSVLHGGLLSGKYANPGATGRVAARRDEAAVASAIAASARLGDFAAARALKPASVAIAFALSHPSVGSVLFGATTPEQVHVNVAGLAAAQTLGADDWSELSGLFPL